MNVFGVEIKSEINFCRFSFTVMFRMNVEAKRVSKNSSISTRIFSVTKRRNCERSWISWKTSWIKALMAFVTDFLASRSWRKRWEKNFRRRDEFRTDFVLRLETFVLLLIDEINRRRKFASIEENNGEENRRCTAEQITGGDDQNEHLQSNNYQRKSNFLFVFARFYLILRFVFCFWKRKREKGEREKEFRFTRTLRKRHTKTVQIHQSAKQRETDKSDKTARNRWEIVLTSVLLSFFNQKQNDEIRSFSWETEHFDQHRTTSRQSFD